jgi:hypothetical protein
MKKKISEVFDISDIDELRLAKSDGVYQLTIKFNDPRHTEYFIPHFSMIRDLVSIEENAVKQSDSLGGNKREIYVGIDVRGNALPSGDPSILCTITENLDK